MADSETASKASKKNQKRRAKKNEGSQPQREACESKTKKPTTPQELIPLLKEQLSLAKEAKDHVRANKLREQIWVLTDMAKGVKTDLKRDELEEILDSIPSSVSHLEETAEPAPPPPVQTSGSQINVGTDKEVKKILKKLDQIEKLKEREAKGEKLEPNQREKISKEEELRQELDIIEKAMQEHLRL